MKLTTDQINTLNIGLMILSCVVAFIFPFELFLLSYAVLGPLHYLTEISWLHDRSYFAPTEKKKRNQRLIRKWLTLVGITMVVLLFGLVMEKIVHQAISPTWEISLFYSDVCFDWQGIVRDGEVTRVSSLSVQMFYGCWLWFGIRRIAR